MKLKKRAWNMIRSVFCETVDTNLVVPNLPPPSENTFPEALMLHYRSKVLPIEKALNLDVIYPVSMNDGEFTSPSTILIVGPPSVGKTTLIQYILNSDYPGMKISPESSADKFTIIMHGSHRFSIPAASLMNGLNFPYPGLNRFGNVFVRKCFVSFTPCPVLQKINIIDTPGIISLEKQKAYRGYDFDSVVTFFADRSDKVIFVFDVYKLDFSEDVRRLINHLQPYEEKIMIVLNKVDSVGWCELDRVQENIMWSLSRTFKRVEVPQVFLGSFWSKPLKRPDMFGVINRYQDQLLVEIRQLPFTVQVRRLNDVIRRAKLARIHALISRNLSHSLPTVKGRAGKTYMRLVLRRLTRRVYPKLITKHKIFFFDLPHPLLIRKLLIGSHRAPKKKVTLSMIHHVEDFLRNDVTAFVSVLPHRCQHAFLKMGRLDVPKIGLNPLKHDWCNVSKEANKCRWRECFYRLKPRHGFLHSSHAKEYMRYAGLSVIILNDIWRLVDSDNDELINEEEFCLLNWLMMQSKRGRRIPLELPKQLRPPDQHMHPCEAVTLSRPEDIPPVAFWPRWE
uniref:EH domain-containing protein n=1 Tax=Trichuris muris TaxID=70415 RepID=A0A5S6Q8P6_TRIMR